MKFTILGFSQRKLIEYKISLDEALILRYFVDFKDSGSMVKEYIDNDLYYWVNYESLKKELPILDISKDRVYRRLKNLVDIGILKHKTKKQGGTYSFYAIGTRYSELVSDSVEIPESTVKIPEGYGKNTGPGTVKIPEGYGENNGTKYPSIKDTSINNPSIKDTYKEIIEYLNLKCNTNFRIDSKETQKLIQARLNEKFTVEDFKTVIDIKSEEWIGTEFERYLWPKTLFSAKFEGYLNQKITKKVNQKSNGNFNNYDQRTYSDDFLSKIEAAHNGWQ